MWRTEKQRVTSAKARLELARQWWRWQPHPNQRKFFCSGTSVRVAACGRRWGKTECLSVDIATLALAEPGSRQLIVAPTEAQARLLGEAVQDRLEKAFIQGDPQGRGRALAACTRPFLLLSIVGPEGGLEASQIACRTAGRDGRNLRGLWAHRIIVDEAAYVPDRVLCEVLPPMLADKGGEFLLASSPNGRRSAFYRLFALGASPAGGVRGGASHGAFQYPTADNGHLDKTWLRSQRDEMGEVLYAQEFEAKFIDDFGLVFREDDIDAALADLPGVAIDKARMKIESEPESGHPYVVGIDWGRKWDYTVVAVLDADRHPFRLVHLSRWRATGWNTQAADAAGIIARFRPRRILADGTSIGDPIAFMLDDEIKRRMGGDMFRPTVQRFLFSPESKQTLIDGMNVAFTARTLQFPPLPVLVNELRNFEYASGGQGRLKMAARGSGHDDCVIALALALHAAPDPALRSAGHGLMLASQYGLAERADPWE